MGAAAVAEDGDAGTVFDEQLYGGEGAGEAVVGEGAFEVGGGEVVIDAEQHALAVQGFALGDELPQRGVGQWCGGGG